jgi:hypothetical protein
MNWIRLIRFLPVLVLLGLSQENARADGGVIRLQKTQGPFVVTIFSSSEVVRNFPADVSVMVQRRDSGDAILDASVSLMFTAPVSSRIEPLEQVCGQSEGAPWSGASDPHSTEISIPATRQQASNKLLYAGLVKFDVAGNWRLQALIKQGAESVEVGCDIPVVSPPDPLVSLLPYLLLPPLMVGLFAVNHGLRRQASASGIGRSNGKHVQQIAGSRSAWTPLRPPNDIYELVENPDAYIREPCPSVRDKSLLTINHANKK